MRETLGILCRSFDGAAAPSSTYDVKSTPGPKGPAR